MEVPQVESARGVLGAEVTYSHLRDSTARSHNGGGAGGSVRARGRGGGRGRGRRASRSLISSNRFSCGAQRETEDRRDAANHLNWLADEKDFCFSSIQASDTGTGASRRTSVNTSRREDAVAALHELLSPNAAGLAFKAGASLSAGWGESAGDAISSAYVYTSYMETPEGSFLYPGALPSSAGSQHFRTEQLCFDMRALNRDMIPFPLPVLVGKCLDVSNSVGEKQLLLGACVVPPLKSSNPIWITQRDDDDPEGKGGTNTASIETDYADRDDDATPMQSDTRGAFPQTDALLNVGGSIRALAVSQECGVEEALAHCRHTRRDKGYPDSPERNEGFVVLAVSVGPVQRSSTSDVCRPCGATGLDTSSVSQAASPHGEGSGDSTSENIGARAGPEFGLSARQQHKKVLGQLQLWTIPNNCCREPRLRVILQHEVSMGQF